MVSVTDPFTGTVDYAYDLAGNRAAITVTTEGEAPSATHYTYDGDNRLIRVSNWATGTTTYGYDAAGQLITTTLPNSVVTVRQYDAAGHLTHLTHRKSEGTLLSTYSYVLDGVGNTTLTTETLVVSGTATTRIITNTYDALNRQTAAAYSTGEAFAYHFDAVGNRQQMTSTTPLSGTVVTTYTFDVANRLTDRAVSDGRAYTYTWSHRGQMLTEWTNGIPVRTFDYDGTGQMVQATVFTLTTDFVYNGLGARVAVSVAGQTTRYTLDYVAGNRILAESTPTNTLHYLYGHDCLGQYTDAESLYYLPDATGYVRQGVDDDGGVVSVWLFDPDGTVLEGSEGPVSHLVCGGMYDWSTGLIYQNGRYFDPNLGIWLALLPLAVVQGWKKKRKGRHPWVMMLCAGLLVCTILVACECEDENPPPNRCLEKTSNVFHPQPNKVFEPQVKLPIVYNQYTDVEIGSLVSDVERERMQKASCGATCMAMVLRYYEYSEEEGAPEAVIQRARREGYWDAEGGGIRPSFMYQLYKKQPDENNLLYPGGYGFEHVKYYDEKTLKISDVAYAMERKIPLQIGVTGGVDGACNGLKGGTLHDVLIVGLSEDQETIMVADPSCGSIQAYDSCLILSTGYAIEPAKIEAAKEE